MNAPDLADYALLAARIGAAYPTYRITEMTLADWTERLSEVDDLEHASRIAQRLRNLPSPPDPKDWQLARRDTREVDYTYYALPAGPPEPMDDATRERWEALKARLKERPITRAYPAALDDVPDADLAKPEFILRRDSLCEGFGKPAVRVHGKLVCPDCHMPLDGSEPLAPTPPGGRE